jgi:hypothetical protein
MIPRPSHIRASALLLVLWALFVLTAGVLVWASFIRQTLAVAGEQQNDTEARAMAHSGASLALHPLVGKETPVLQAMAESDPGYRVQMVSEGGKLNVNALLGGQDPIRLDLFKRWLESRGVEFNAREHIVDCMLDWLDGDNLKRINGQEDTTGYHPPNRGQFLSVEEIAEVAGTEPLTSQAGWQDDLTVDSQGPIDVTSAEKNILRLLPGISDGGIDRFLKWRKGPDGIDGTLDDPKIEKLETVQAFLGMNKAQWDALGGMVSLKKDPNWRITVTGWSGKVVRQVVVVAAKGSQNPQIKKWKE